VDIKKIGKSKRKITLERKQKDKEEQYNYGINIIGKTNLVKSIFYSRPKHEANIG
jgi:hypothetical protein